MEISALRLYQIIAEKSDNKIASEVVTAVQETIKEEVKREATSQINAMKGELIDRINATNDRISTAKQELSDRMDNGKMQTWGLIIGIGVLQLVAYYFLK